jgi:hypothetical protein
MKRQKMQSFQQIIIEILNVLEKGCKLAQV